MRFEGRNGRRRGRGFDAFSRYVLLHASGGLSEAVLGWRRSAIDGVEVDIAAARLRAMQKCEVPAPSWRDRREDRMLLEGKTALVYGAGGAVGGAMARAFAGQGARVILAGRTAAPLEATAREIASAGGQSEVMPVDATDRAAVEAHIAAAADRAGPMKVMFNAAGWADSQGEELTAMSFDRFNDVVAVALRTWFVTGTAMARHMRQHRGGTIVGITANAARDAYAMVGGFGVACATVEHFLRQLGVENGQYGVRVGWVRSAGSPDAPGVREAWTLRANEQGITLAEFEKRAGATVPLRHLPALAEVADAAVLMASDLSRGMTSTFMNVTCGAQTD